MVVKDFEYLYLTRGIGQENIEETDKGNIILCKKLEKDLLSDPIKTKEVYDDVQDLGFSENTINNYIIDCCINTRFEDSCNILLPEEGNPKTFKIINRDIKSKIAIIRIPAPKENYCDEWFEVGVITQDQYDYLKLLDINKLRWQYESFCSNEIDLNTVKVAESSSCASEAAVSLALLGLSTFLYKYGI